MKTLIRLSSAILLIAVIVCCALSSMGKERTYVSAFSKSDNVGSAICFSQEDFSLCVTGSEKITEIKIYDLPVYGQLTIGDKVVNEGEYISASDFGSLKYSSFEAEDTEDKIGIIPVLEKSGTLNEPVYISVFLTDKTNYSPVAVNASFKTYSNIKLMEKLTVVDVDEDKCTFEIIQKPKKGKVTIEDSYFIYEPNTDKSGKDSFEFRAIDNKGNTSNTAKVSIEIIKPSSKESFSYSDMSNSDAHFEALYLREQGIMVGETFGEENFFYPDTCVTRAQFVALVAAISDMAIPTVSVGTGLEDNEDIPEWARSYVAAAINCGVIYGENTSEGNKTFRANDFITRAEAASIINRAIGLADENRTLECSDVDNVPAWAEQSIINTTAAGLITVFDDNTVKANESVTREDAAKMLYQTINYLEKQKDSKSFWEKLFN